MPQEMFRRARGLCLAAVGAFALLGLSAAAGPARAGMVPTEAVIEAAAGEAGARARVGAFLDRAEVRRHLEALGVDPAEAMARVESLSEEEIALVAGKLDEAPAGAAAALPVETLLVIVLVIVLIVLLI